MWLSWFRIEITKSCNFVGMNWKKVKKLWTKESEHFTETLLYFSSYTNIENSPIYLILIWFSGKTWENSGKNLNLNVIKWSLVWSRGKISRRERDKSIAVLAEPWFASIEKRNWVQRCSRWSPAQGLSPDLVAGPRALSPLPYGRPSGARLFSALVQSPKKSKLVSAREEEEEEEESEEETKADDEERRLPSHHQLAQVQDVIFADFEVCPDYFWGGQIKVSSLHLIHLRWGVRFRNRITNYNTMLDNCAKDFPHL